MSNKLELMRKVKALADRGVGGEKEAAKATLTRLMEKHGISEAELEAEQKKHGLVLVQSGD